ncbi:hypothetical protein FOCC_FOCC007122, partial [Frankliniella occidentalis]
VGRYETRAASIPSTIPPGVYIQFGFDNADFNSGTIDGKNTRHMMGGIMMMTPANIFVPTPVPRKIAEEDTIPLSERAFIPVETYQREKEPPPTVVQDLQVLVLGFQSSRSSARHQDAVWLCGSWLKKNVPGWHGFMSNATKLRTDFAASDIQALPFVNLSPSNPSTIYSCLRVASQKCEDHNQKHCIVTFDLPLYVKAKSIADECLPNIIPRLGGFHTLMSFMGAAGHIMNGSGLEELWQTVYAENSIPKMLGGHAYSRALRAHILTRLALITVVLEAEDVPLRHMTHMQSVFNNVLQNKVTLEQVAEDRGVAEVSELIEQFLQNRADESRTGKLWVQYIRMVEIMCDYLRSERSGNWNLQLATYEAMLPFFHAAGHLNYAKATRMHLQDMLQLEKKMDGREFEIFTTSGYFAIRRVKKVVKFWEGMSGDMTIEQWLMKAFKATGGLTSRGFSETIVAKWLHSLHGSVEHIMALQDFCGLSTGSSEQHVEMRDSRRKTDSAHLSKMVLWLRSHSPFTRPANLLVSLANGIVGSEDVNCDRAEIGRKCISEMVGKSFEDLHLRRKDKVTSLGSTGKSVKLGERDVVMIDSMQLFHRIICVVKDEPDLRNYFSFELAPTPLSLFDSMGFSRKGTKAMLVPALSEYSAAGLQLPSNPKYTIDGGYLLHKVVWSCPTDFAEISAGYIAFVKRHYYSSPVVVFDGYEAANLREAHIQVVEAPGDADRVIVSTAIKRAQSNPRTNHVVVGEDTDLLVLVIALTPDDTSLHFLKPGKGATKNQGKKHALSKLVKSTSAFKTRLEVFNQADSTHDAVAEVGEAFMLLLYGAPARFKCLNEYRFHLYTRIISKQALTTRFTLAALPPTKSAARQFFYRVYFQVQAWWGQDLDPTAWGFKRVSGYLRAVWSTQEVAPPELLKLIACGCRGMCDTQRCECLKSGLRCSSICGFCQGHSCANRAEDDDDDNEESVDDPV